MFLVFSAFLAAGQAAPVTVKADGEDKIICRRERSEVGTHMRPKKKCLRKSEWALMEEATKRELRQMQDHSIDPGYAGVR